MQHGVLPDQDRHLLTFELWLTGHLAQTAQPHRQLLDQYATWHVLRKLRDIAARQPLGSGRDKDARLKIRKAGEFLVFLDARGRTLSQCTQADLDAWHADHRLARRPAQQFLRWNMRARNMPRLEIPIISTKNPAPLSQHRRVSLIKRFLEGDDIPLRDRVTATLILLYAQPISRIVRLTIDDITTGTDGEVLLELGDPPTPVPEPFASLLLQHATNRQNMHTATNPGSRGCSLADEPASPSTRPPSPNGWATLASTEPTPAPQRSASSSSKPPPQSSPACSATTTTPSPRSQPKPQTRAATPPEPRTVTGPAIGPANTPQTITRPHQFSGPLTGILGCGWCVCCLWGESVDLVLAVAEERFGAAVEPHRVRPGDEHAGVRDRFADLLDEHLVSVVGAIVARAAGRAGRSPCRGRPGRG